MTEERISTDTGQDDLPHLTLGGSLSPPPPESPTKGPVDTNFKPSSTLLDTLVHTLALAENSPHQQLYHTTIDTSVSTTTASSIHTHEADDLVDNSAETLTALDEEAYFAVAKEDKKGSNQDPGTAPSFEEQEHIDNNNEPIQGITILGGHRKPHQASLVQHGPQQLTVPILDTPAKLSTPIISPTHSYLYLEDDEDEGERGTVLILTRSHPRGFRRGSIASISTVSSAEASISCDTARVQKAEDLVVSRFEEGSSPAMPVPSEVSTSVGESNFILQPSGFDPHDNNVATITGSRNPTFFSSSVSSSVNSSPVAQTHRPRPFSQQPFPVSFVHTPPASTQTSQLAIEEDELQFQHLRRSRSLPSSPKSFGSFEVVSLSTFDSPRATTNRYSEYVSAPKLEQELSCDWLPSQHSPTCPLHYGPDRESEIITREDLQEDPDSLLSESLTSQPQLLTSPGERPRRQSLLSPRQLQRLSRQKDIFPVRAKETSAPIWKTRLGYLGKDHHKKTDRKAKGSSAQRNGSNIKDPNSTLTSGQRSFRLTGPTVPSIAFQLHQTEISTERPSVSGRLILHIPRRPGKKFHFVSLALHLRLKESIAWTRHDLFSFEVESHHWAQTVWDKKMMIPFQDRQVEEGDAEAFGSRMAKGISPAAAIAAAASAAPPGSKSTTVATPTAHGDNFDTSDAPHIQPVIPPTERSALDSQYNQHSHLTGKERLVVRTESHPNTAATQVMAMDEWRWEWLLPVTRNEVRPESFEGSMGMVWYELEAKCLFRWDDVDKDGNVIPNDNTIMITNASGAIAGTNSMDHGRPRVSKSPSGSSKLLKGFGASTKKAKSIAQAFGKLRVGNKPKSTTGVGDFNIPSLHEQYIQNSIRKTQEAAEAAAAAAASAAVEAAEVARVVETHLGHYPDSRQGEQAQGVADHGQQSESAGDSESSSNGSIAAADQISVAFNATSSAVRSTVRLPSIPEPIPFLARRTLKLYFSRPTPKTSSNPAFFLPQPMMSLPTLPSTRRLKAIIPGARIQVQIQVPSMIPIPGYAQSSQLVPSNKTGGLVPIKGSSNTLASTASNIFGDKFVTGHSRRNSKDHHHQQDDRYPRNFQAALTIRKITQQDINKNESLRRRYEFAESAAVPIRRYSADPDTVVTSHGAINEPISQGPSRARALSHQADIDVASPSRSAVDEHGPDDMMEIVTAYPCSDDRTDDKGKQQGVVEAPDPLKPIQSKGWRKEIRVRKVKCEFWQKESCRIPTDEAPSRSIKVQLAPVYSYSEKEHEKERQRQAAAQQHSSISSEPLTSSPLGDFHLQPLQQSRIRESNTQDEGSSGPLSSFLKAGRRGSIHTSGQGPTESLKPWISRKGSNCSIFQSTLPQPLPHALPIDLSPAAHTQCNQPFMLLVPVPLDNPRLRQTFSWPSLETPSPIAPSAYDYSLPRNTGAESSIGFGSEFDYPSQPTLYEMMGTVSRGGGPTATTIPSGPPAKARIEVKHYLSFRLSLDMLEYEGEPEQEDIDLEAIEEQQLQEARDRQDLSLAFDRPAANGASSQLSAAGLSSTLTTAVQHHGSRGAYSSPVTPPNTTNSFGAGLTSEYGTEPGLKRLGMAYERRGSKESLGTVRSTTSGNSTSNIGAGGGGTLSTLSQTHASSALSGASNVSDRTPPTPTDNCGRSGGLVAGAIGALKKKASAVGLGNIVGASSASTSAQQHHSTDHPLITTQRRVTVQKLKDFVIRVPITIVIQIDDRGKVTNTFGTTDNSAINSAIPAGSRHFNDTSSNVQSTNNEPRSSTNQFNGPVNITSTATTTVKNIVTGSSGDPRHSIDPLESTGTFGSLISMAASAGSEPLRKRMDDFAMESSSLAFAGLKRRKDHFSPTAHHHVHPLLQQQQQQQQLYHPQSPSHGPSLLPLTSECLQQHLRANDSQHE
ncbi:hypothetical protein BG015_009921 [Linnemannia schmuckeri]|uniref:Uncharacterized protein n=1 Tax=Linnemannia schmuckeri TaxID=64567 RepID=A0A9P5RXI8_9FUNG|nr:hypothetical protein BG015_009921 [Linnemannia schmuckeri]